MDTRQNTKEEIAKALSSFLSGFSYWLDREIDKIKPDRIIFCSREGWTLGKAFTRLCGNRSKIPMKYIYISRRSMAISRKKTLDYSKILNSPCADCTLKDFMYSRFGYNKSISNYNLKSAGFLSTNDIINRNKDYNKLEKLYLLLENDIEEIRQSQYSMALDYYSEIGLCKGKNLIVDIGYNGTVQNYFTSLFPHAVFHTRYVWASNRSISNPFIKSWLTDKYFKLSNKCKIFQKNLTVFEFLLSTSDPCFAYFDKSEKFIFNKSSLLKENEFINEVQNLSFQYLFDDRVSSKRIMASPLLNLINNPNHDLILQLYDLSFDDYYGGDINRKLIDNLYPLFKCSEDIYLYLKKASWVSAANFLVYQNLSKKEKFILNLKLFYIKVAKFSARLWRSIQK